MNLSTIILLSSAFILVNGFKINKQHSNEELVDIMITIHNKCPNITTMYYLKYGDIDKTIMHNRLYVIVFGKYPTRHTEGIPEFGWLSNEHGNEIIGREFSVLMADFLCTKYLEGDSYITKLIYSMRIHFLSSMNPDGYLLRTDVYGYGEGHNNYFFQDLNHDFPDLGTEFFKKLEKLEHNVTDHMFTREIFLQKKYQRETLMTMNWLLTIPWVLQVSLHSATLVFNYGYQQSLDKYKRVYNPTPDDNIYRYIGARFVARHPEMKEWRVRCPTYWIYVPNGVQKGSTWLSVKNGWHDFSYLSTNMLGNNIFLSCQRNMLPANIQFHWRTSLPSLLYYLRQVHMGVKGVVRDDEGNRIQNAVIKTVNLTDSEPYVQMRFLRTGELGDYYRILIPGDYAIMVSKTGYNPAIRCFRVDNEDKFSAKIVNFELPRDYYYLDPECSRFNLDQTTVHELLDMKV